MCRSLGSEENLSPDSRMQKLCEGRLITTSPRLQGSRFDAASTFDDLRCLSRRLSPGAVPVGWGRRRFPATHRGVGGRTPESPLRCLPRDCGQMTCLRTSGTSAFRSSKTTSTPPNSTEGLMPASADGSRIPPHHFWTPFGSGLSPTRSLYCATTFVRGWTSSGWPRWGSRLLPSSM